MFLHPTKPIQYSHDIVFVPRLNFPGLPASTVVLFHILIHRHRHIDQYYSRHPQKNIFKYHICTNRNIKNTKKNKIAILYVYIIYMCTYIFI